MFSKSEPRLYSRNSLNLFNMKSENQSSMAIKIPEKDLELQNREEHLYLLCIDLKNYSPPAQFLICCSGVFIFYLIYGYFQELIFKLNGFKPYGMYLTFIQFLFYSIFGYIERIIRQEGSRKIPFKSYLIIATLTVGTMGCSNTSLGFLNYPTQVIFKCCKLIPVLVMGIFIQGKRYNKLDVTACLCMSIGLIFFTLADSKVYPNFSLFGVFLISLALMCDAVIGNFQEKIMKQFRATNTEMVLYSYSIGVFILIAMLLITGELVPAFIFCLDYPIKTYGYALVFSLCGYLGVNIVLSLIKISGALTAVTVTTLRKALSIILSFTLFSKPFTAQYLWSGAIVLLGIYLNVYSKNRESINQTCSSLYRRLRQKHKYYEKPTENV